MSIEHQEQLCEVVVVGVETGLFQAYLEHLDGLIHEIKLVDAGTTVGMASAGPELAELIEAIVAGHVGAFATAREQVAAAQDLDKPTFDLAVVLPRAAGGAATELMALLDRADELAAQGLLLTIPAPGPVRELRHRLRDQVVAQLEAAATAQTT